jgi:hypothetical protein
MLLTTTNNLTPRFYQGYVDGTKIRKRGRDGYMCQPDPGLLEAGNQTLRYAG